MTWRRFVESLAAAALVMLSAGCAGPSVQAGVSATPQVAFAPAPVAQLSGTWRGPFYEIASHRTSKVMEGDMVIRIAGDGTFTATSAGRPQLTGTVTVKGNRVIFDSSSGSRVTLMRSGNTLYGLARDEQTGANVAIRLDLIEPAGQ